MGKAPAFQLYAADFYLDTVDWTNEEIGIYFRLLMSEWVNGPLDPDPARLARIAKTSTKNFQKNWKKLAHKFPLCVFENDGEKLINLRLEDTRTKQDKYRKSQSDRATAGWRKRDAGAYAGEMPEGMPKRCSSSSSSNNTPYIPHSGDVLVKKNSTEKIPLKDAVQEVLSVLNETRTEITGKPSTRTVSDNIKARLKEGYTVNELCRIILFKATQEHFRKDNALYLRESTLFRKSNTKIYLEEANEWKDQTLSEN